MCAEYVKKFEEFINVKNSTLLMSTCKCMLFLCVLEIRKGRGETFCAEQVPAYERCVNEIYGGYDAMSFEDRIVYLAASWSNDLHDAVKEELQKTCPNSPLLKGETIWEVIYGWLESEGV